MCVIPNRNAEKEMIIHLYYSWFWKRRHNGKALIIIIILSPGCVKLTHTESIDNKLILVLWHKLKWK